MSDKILLDQGHPPPLYTKPRFFEKWIKQLREKRMEKSTVEKAKNIAKLLKRQAKEKPLPPLDGDDEWWEVDEAYREELEARVEAGVAGG